MSLDKSMIANITRGATCRVSCGSESGTAFLVSESTLLTARHCVIAAIESGTPIEIISSSAGGDFTLYATLLGSSEDLDAALLQVANLPHKTPLPLLSELPREGSDWESFGYPEGKQLIGHRTMGTIAQVLGEPRNRLDIDLAIDPTTTLQSYNGYSGAAVVTDGASCGMIRLKLDGTIGAISIQQLWGFLLKYDIVAPGPKDATSTPDGESALARRDEFQQEFEDLVIANPGTYVFLEGAHGIGKTTFCNAFDPSNASLLNIGAYTIRTPDRGVNPAYRMQPEIFFDWLLTSVTTLITGEAPRKGERAYAMLVTETAGLLTAFSDYCSSTKRRGILFLDGLNEAQPESANVMAKLIGLLPLVLPPHLTIILTAPNYSVLAAELSGRVKTDNVRPLPPLSDDSASSYCWQELRSERRTVALIARICEKAKGHPLYLRYLIEYANSTPDDDILDEFPVLSGPIEEYYELIWARLAQDADAIQLLAIIARLRWGIPTNALLGTLTQSEQTVFLPTVARIRHLLLTPDNTAIYHPSFATFLKSKTAALDTLIHARLALFCATQSAIDYCLVNLIYHFLHADAQTRLRAVTECQQEWIDRCVERGVDPEVLLADVEATTLLAIEESSASEALRLLLLTQRVTFRYNTLFAQSAKLIAKALIALKRPQEALQHCVRFGILIISPDETLEVAYVLIKGGFLEEATHLMDRSYQRILEAYSDSRMNLETFLRISEMHLRTLFFMRLADDRQTMPQVLRVLEGARGILAKFADEENRAFLDQCWLRLSCISTSYFVSFRDTYADLKVLRRLTNEEVPKSYLEQLIFVLFDCDGTIATFRLDRNVASLKLVFADIAEMLTAGATVAPPLRTPLLDALIRLGAPAEFVRMVANGHSSLTEDAVTITASNGVDVDYSKILRQSVTWRIRSYLNEAPHCPIVGAFDQANWLSSVRQLIQALFWCDGRARRAKAEVDEELARESLETLEGFVLKPLRFALLARVKWQDSYAIPEQVFPFIYDHLITLLSDCFPDALLAFVGDLLRRAPDQFGLYSEGYREVMNVVIRALSGHTERASLSSHVLTLLRQWSSHVTKGVENRHELVPELLRLIALFGRMGASEEASRLYRKTLAVSMGPTWYKEDQFGLLTSFLAEMPASDNVRAQLGAIAGYLERASGEMTFQRFVRFEKSMLLGQLFRRGMFSEGCRYFERQTCGTRTELTCDRALGIVDRPRATEGMRHPGGALDEQEAILQLVKNSPTLDWRLRWALLEIFQCGDERHLTDYAATYAELLNGAEIGSAAFAEMVQRAEFIIGCEIAPQDRPKFAGAFRDKIDTAKQSALAKIVVWAPPRQARELGPSLAPGEIAKEGELRDSAGRDEFFLPGVFGRQSSIRESEKVEKEAKHQRNLGNLAAAKVQAVQALQILQEDGWPIWNRSLGKARSAESLLREGATDAAEVFRCYRPLVESEQYAPKWVIAQHLFLRGSDLMTEAERTQALKDGVEHVHLMVGDAPSEIGMFGFLGEEGENSEPSGVLFKFILWLTDHPQWLRRDRAAAVIAWLLEIAPDFTKVALETAFSRDEGYGPEVLCGVFDRMSSLRPLEVWDLATTCLDIGAVLRDCKHVSRLTVLHRIAERAGNAGSVTGAELTTRVRTLFRAGAIELDAAAAAPELPDWANCVRSEWKSLFELEVITDEVKNELTAEMGRLSAPLSIEDAWDLEQAVSISFRQSAHRKLSRWEGKVRYALNLALLPFVTVHNFRRVESVMRVFNPLLPERTVIPGSRATVERALQAIADAADYSGLIGDAVNFFLNYNAMVEVGDAGEMLHLEVIALTVPSSAVKRQFFLPKTIMSFRSREFPNLESAGCSDETCCHLQPETAIFGSFTPAFPLPSFVDAIQGNATDFFRTSWRSGRSDAPRWIGRPLEEGCALSVKKKAVQLPEDRKLAWIVCVTGQPVIMVDSQNHLLF